MPLNQSKQTTLVLLNEKPFYLDSDVTIHILLYRSDFESLQAIPPHAIKGIGSLSIDAIRMGRIYHDI